MELSANNSTGPQRISTLDVLWAFYISQPQRIRKAFRNKMESEEKAKAVIETEPIQWKTDMKAIRLLKDNWDGEGAPSISRVAVGHVNKLLLSLNKNIAIRVRLFPTYLGAVMLKLETENGRIKCELGDRQMSYFVKRPGAITEHHSFEEITPDTLAVLKVKLQSII